MKYAVTVALMGLALLAQARTPESNSERSAAPTQPRPAGASGGGALTPGVAEAFEGNADEPGEKTGRGDGIRSSYVYKTVGKDELQLYVDTPKGHKASAKVPAIVLFHGGGFKTGSVNQFKDQAEYLADRGMVAVRVRYRLTRDKGVEVTDCIEDAISAMRWVRSHAGKLGVDPDRVAAGGGSAGGYLAAATLLVDFISAKTDPTGVSARPNALVLFNPGFGGSEKGEGPDPRDPEGKGDLRKYVKEKLPPVINFFGTEDPLLADAKRFQEAYKKAGNRFELLTYEGETHSFFNKPKYRDLTLAETDKFLVELDWLAKPAKAP